MILAFGKIEVEMNRVGGQGGECLRSQIVVVGSENPADMIEALPTGADRPGVIFEPGKATIKPPIRNGLSRNDREKFEDISVGVDEHTSIRIVIHANEIT